MNPPRCAIDAQAGRHPQRLRGLQGLPTARARAREPLRSKGSGVDGGPNEAAALRVAMSARLGEEGRVESGADGLVGTITPSREGAS
jgi:hypothetical protein